MRSEIIEGAGGKFGRRAWAARVGGKRGRSLFRLAILSHAIFLPLFIAGVTVETLLEQLDKLKEKK